MFFHLSEDKNPSCERCRVPLERLFNAMTFIGVEFKSGHGFDPSVGKDRSYHGGHFDLAAGRYFNDKNERKAWMKSKGLKEVGTDWDKKLDLKNVKDETKIQQEKSPHAGP
jgi:hypothetical protein